MRINASKELMKRLETKQSIQMKASDRSRPGYFYDIKAKQNKYDRVKLKNLKFTVFLVSNKVII